MFLSARCIISTAVCTYANRAMVSPFFLPRLALLRLQALHGQPVQTYVPLPLSALPQTSTTTALPPPMLQPTSPPYSQRTPPVKINAPRSDCLPELFLLHGLPPSARKVLGASYESCTRDNLLSEPFSGGSNIGCVKAKRVLCAWI